ncbi:MAG TPA: hypothetical protein VFV38_06070 [Ktedonobacteraceae bacterium]|nr:hypothetical protein [Ktedonobacteraceae bacterium]
MLLNTEERAEKGRTEASTPGERFAYWLSQITSPFVIGLATLGYASLSTAPAVTDSLVWWAVIGMGMSVPFSFVWLGVKKGHFTDIHVSRRSQRLLPLLVGLGCICGMLAGLILLHASRALVVTLVAVLISFSVATGITQLAKYKISFHVASAAGAVTVCCLLANPVLVVLSPLVVLIAWARWKLEAHTPLQALCSAVLAVVVTVTTFRLFGLR